MRSRRAPTVLTMAAAMAVAAEGLAGGTSKAFLLTITGEPTVRFEARCITTGAGERVLEFEGTVPIERTIVAESVRCRLQADGRIAVELSYEGGRSRSVINGGTAYVAAQ